MPPMKTDMRAYSALWMFCVGGALLLAACGSSSSTKCGPENCQGCCTEEGLCATGGQDQTCGQAGEQCSMCPQGQVCVSGLCMYSNPGYDLAMPMPDMATPQPDLATTQPPDMTTTQPDLAMPTPDLAMATPDMTPPPADLAIPRPDLAGSPAHVGDACSSNTDCAALGSGALCKKTTTAGNGSYNGGYCALPCVQPSDCPSGSTCTSLAESGESTVCLANCSSGSPCRSGYACYSLSIASVCWISPAPPAPTPPTGVVGKACTSDTQCDTAYPAGFCITAADYGWPGGYCSGDCSYTGVCADDAVCLLLDDNDTSDPSDDFYGCLKTCTKPGNGGGTDCKSSDTCSALFDESGTRQTFGYCNPKCTASTDCPTQYPTCSITGNCCNGTDCI